MGISPFALVSQDCCLRTSVPHDVASEVFFPYKCLSTGFTAKRRLIGVRTHVVHEMLLPSEFLVTDLPTMRDKQEQANNNELLIHTRMPHDVIREVFLPRELFVADFTTKGRLMRMRDHVIIQVLFPYELLTTHLMDQRDESHSVENTTRAEQTPLKHLSIVCCQGLI